MVNEYYMNKDIIKLYERMTQDIHHELGHRFWYRELPSMQRSIGKIQLKVKKVSIERTDVENFVEKYFDKSGSKLYKRRAGLKVINRQEDNAETKAKFKALQMTPVYSTENRKEVVTKLADRLFSAPKKYQ